MCFFIRDRVVYFLEHFLNYLKDFYKKLEDIYYLEYFPNFFDYI
uniref:Uncharacterized protein n=1 Tax=viral metagenome TaxID=1070528 RepID=A0A6C0AFG5_9ZZZZ